MVGLLRRATTLHNTLFSKEGPAANSGKGGGGKGKQPRNAVPVLQQAPQTPPGSPPKRKADAPPDKRAAKLAKMVCFHCGEKGHLAAQCKNKKKEKRD